MDEPPIATSADAETAHKIGRKSARSPRIEVITRSDRRRVWTLEQKREIVAESLGPGLTPTEVARKHAISSGLLYALATEGARRADDAAVARAAGLRPSGDRRLRLSHRTHLMPRPAPGDACPRPAGLIEIVLPEGVTLRVDAEVDAAALGRVLAALDQR